MGLVQRVLGVRGGGGYTYLVAAGDALRMSAENRVHPFARAAEVVKWVILGLMGLTWTVFWVLIVISDLQSGLYSSAITIAVLLLGIPAYGLLRLYRLDGE